MTIWSEDGINHYGWNPVMTYSGDQNKFINNHANTSGQMVDEHGNYYYVSHPPFAYYLPFFVFAGLGLVPSVLGIQIFNMAMHFLAALFVYFIVNLLSNTRARSKLFIPALVAFLIYCFMPATLWFHSNVYMSDMLVQVVFVIGVYISLKMFIRRRFQSFKYLFFYSLVVFLMVFTSWLGVFFTGAVLLYTLIKMQREREFAIPVLFAIVSSAAALLMMIWLYSGINGPEAYLAELKSRFLIRSSFQGSGGFMDLLVFKAMQFKDVLFNYVVSYLPVFGLIGVLVFFIVTRKRPRLVFTRNGYRFLWLSCLPVLLLHLFLLDYSGHDFTALYGSLVIAVVVGILYDKILHMQSVKAWMLQAAVTVTVLACVVQYFYINRPGEISLVGDRYDTHMVLAGEVNANLDSGNEVIFFQGSTPSPELIFYAGVNIKSIESEAEALEFLEQRELTEGKIFYINENSGIDEIQRVSIP